MDDKVKQLEDEAEALTNEYIALGQRMNAIKKRISEIGEEVFAIEYPADKQPAADSARDDNWTLNAAQMTWMMQHHNQIKNAYATDDMEWCRHWEQAEDYTRVFGDMSWDEAYDRYECMFEDDNATTD